MRNVFLYDLFLVYEMPSFGGLYFTRGNLGRLPLVRKKKKKTGCSVGKTNGTVNTKGNFPEKKNNLPRLSFFFQFYRDDWNFL